MPQAPERRASTRLWRMTLAQVVAQFRQTSLSGLGISTSNIERFNLTVRITLRRFTRLANGHSKSRRHHTAMQALFVAWYDFARKHEALKGNTPVMASGLSDHVWTIKEPIEKARQA